MTTDDKKWALSPQFELEERNINSSKSNLIQVNIHLRSQEDHPNESDFSFAKILYGTNLQPKILYVNNAEGSDFVLILPTQSVKPLSFSSPGNAHVACSLGASLASAISTFQGQFSKLKGSQEIVLHFSPKLSALIGNEAHEFLIGILQKSVVTKPQKNENSHTKKIILCEDIFSRESIHKARLISQAMCETRSFIHMPPNILNPETFEERIKQITERVKKEENLNIQISTLSAENLKELGCNLICAVGQGSSVSPRILKLTYTPQYHSNTTKEFKSIALAGKGITFDSGGYDLKPSGPMRWMKKDMGGAAAAIGVFLACASLKLPVKITCMLALAENMVSGHAMRPGDVYRSHNGKDVEIDNTDAEGRLVLADTLSLLNEEKHDWIIDFATLTGAARVATGTMVDALFGNHQETTALLQQSSEETGDWFWTMPLPSEYEGYLDSSVGDFANSGPSPYAGAITAALFLQKFVANHTCWNHIDTFMWCDKPNFLWAEGNSPTAKCVRAVLKAIENYSKA